MRIGIPRSMTYYFFYPLWKTFFQYLGAEVIVSPPTDKTILEKGTEHSVSEICLPVKVFYGHVASLLEQVDCIFVPAAKSIEVGRYFCPQIIALPQLVKFRMPRAPLLSVLIDGSQNSSAVAQCYIQLGLRMGFSRRQVRAAWWEARQSQVYYLQQLQCGLSPNQILQPKSQQEAEDKYPFRLAVIAHPYVVMDELISMNLVRSCHQLGAQAVLAEKLTTKQVNAWSAHIPKDLFWTWGKRVIAAANYYGRKRHVDGVIFLTPFGCGCDAMIEPHVSSQCQQIPYLFLTIDEHTAPAGFQTRLEAFLDLVQKRSKEKDESSISSNGKLGCRSERSV